MSRALELGSQTAGALFYDYYDKALPKKFAFTPEELERFYILAKADALREAADAVHGDYGMDVDSAAKLRRMAEEVDFAKLAKKGE